MLFQYDEHEQHPHGDRRHRKEVDRHQLADVVVKKRLPRLSRRPAECSENSGNGTLGDFDAEHHQFAVNSRPTPQRIGRHHPFDQPAYLGSSRRSAASSSVHPGEACPELAKALPLPADDRDNGELLNWATISDFSGFDSMPGCAMLSCFSFI